MVETAPEPSLLMGGINLLSRALYWFKQHIHVVRLWAGRKIHVSIMKMKQVLSQWILVHPSLNRSLNG